MIEFDELIDIVPDPAVLRMENVGTIAMDMDAVLLFTIDIAADMAPTFQDQALLAGLMHLVGKDTAKEAAADDDVIVHNLVPHFVINGLRESLVRRPQVAFRSYTPTTNYKLYTTTGRTNPAWRKGLPFYWYAGTPYILSAWRTARRMACSTT